MPGINQDPTQDNSSSPEEYERNCLAEQFYSQSNSYDVGPGAELPFYLQPCEMARDDDCVNRKSTGVYLKGFTAELKRSGIRNLCSKYGRVQEVKLNTYSTGRAAVIKFASLADAENCLKCIGSSNLVKHAEFQKVKDKNENDQLLQNVSFTTFNADALRVDLPNRANPVDLQLFEPKPLLPIEFDQLEMLEEYYNQTSNNTLLKPDLQKKNLANGRVIYRHSPEIINKMRQLHIDALGVMDITKHEFVHKGIPNVSETGDCKNCRAITLTFCKECKDFFCSLHCFKQCKRTSLGCSCNTPKVSDLSGKLPSRNGQTAIGRGGKIKLSRSLTSPSPSPSPDCNRSISSNDSDYEAVSSGKWGKRLQMLQKFSMLNQKTNEITIEPCELPSDTNLVTIIYIVDHKTVFLRSVDVEDKYLLYLNDIVECSKTAMPLKKMPDVGDIVLAELEDSYYRAVVTRIEGDAVVVAFPEFGNLEEKSINQLKVLRDDLKYVKRFIFKAQLSDMDEEVKNEKCLSYLYHLAEGKVLLQFIRKEKTSAGDHSAACELIVRDTNLNVKGKMKLLNSLKTYEDSFVSVNDIVHLELEGDNVAVIVVDNSAVAGYVNVVRSDNMEKICRMQQRIAEYCKADYGGTYTPRREEVCLAKCGNNWYRVIMIESYGDRKPLMQFIDFGNQNLVPIENMRPMPIEFDYPNYSVFVKIGDCDYSDPEQAESAMQQQKEFLPILTEIRVRVQKEEDIPIIFINERQSF